MPQSAYEAEETYALPGAVVDYVNHLLHAAFYERGEVPVEALWSYNVDYYLAQVNNGGHGQFVSNSGWMAAMREDITAGLAAMRATDAAEIFAELQRFALEEPARFAQAAEGGGFGEADPVIAGLDDRFFAGPSATIAAANGAWLRSLPHLRVVADGEHRATLDALTDANPAAAARRAERDVLVREAQERNPLVQTFVYLLGKAKPPLVYQGWNAGFPRESPDGTIVHLFGINSDQGTVYALLSPGGATLLRTMAGEAIVTVPISELDPHLRKKTGQVLADVLRF